jgi:hypothetical protein
MRISQLRNDIKELAQPILLSHGFSMVGELGEHFKTGENGNKLAVLIEEVKGSSSFSVSIRTFVRYENIESSFVPSDSDSEYTINKIVANESIGFDCYTKKNLGEILNKLISVEAVAFLNEYCSDEAIVSNLSSIDYQNWVTSDKVAQFKVRLASAIQANDVNALATAKDEALKFCDKPWSEPSREVILRLCACV